MDHPLYKVAWQLIDDSGLQRINEQLKSYLKLGIGMKSHPSASHPLPLGASKLGGVPDFPMTFTWPTWKGIPMVFLAQIHTQEVALYDLEQLLPSHGFLYFFCQSQNFSRGFDINGWDYINPDRKSTR